LLFEVRNGTGYQRTTRTADAIAMSLWPSRGLELCGFEIKVSKSDWQSELRQPAKAESICQFCDRWWMVAAPDVIEISELPPTWGLLVPTEKGDKLRTVREAPVLNPKPVDRLFLAALMRRTAVTGAEELKEEFKKGVEVGKVSEANELKFLKEDFDSLTKCVGEFERASGVSIQGWEGASNIGMAVRSVLNGTDKHILKRLLSLKTTAAEIHKQLEVEIAKLEPVP
jgi:hypothetical protein